MILEKICTFADECDLWINYHGSRESFPVCYNNYVDCKKYQEIIIQKLKKELSK